MRMCGAGIPFGMMIGGGGDVGVGWVILPPPN